MFRLVGLAVVVGGCGRFGFDLVGPLSIDAADAPADAPAPTGPFGTPTLASVSTTGAAEDDPTLTADQLEIYFDSNRTGGMGGGDLWTATRSSTTAVWGAARNVSELNTTGDDATPEVSRDGLTLYWVANGAAGAKDIWVATRADRTATWSGQTRVVELASAADESGPCVTPGGLAFYFSRDPSGTDDLYVSSRTTTSATWNPPTVISELSQAGVLDGEPFINGTNTLLLWSSGRSGANDLYLARRSSPADTWGTPTPIAELNTASPEGDPWLSPDEHVIYFSRNLDIYMATR
ncbi:MAG TPA: hypothetical protein VIV40_09240 [Kofleriaceae bacterium]